MGFFRNSDTGNTGCDVSSGSISIVALSVNEFMPEAQDGALPLHGINSNPFTNNMRIPESTGGIRAWDPRLKRLDGFLGCTSTGPDKATAIIPFATETAASAYKDRKFMLPKAALDAASGTGDPDPNTNTGPQIGIKRSNSMSPASWVHVSGNGSEVDLEAGDPRYYGVASLMNPYSLTVLCGGLGGAPTITTDSDGSAITEFANNANNMYDIRDHRRFYDVLVGRTASADASLGSPANDVLTVSNPTTTNIIKLSNSDLWGRTPYSFQDFVYCKWWNVIPNNRLITLRKFQTPCVDNLTFSEMYTKEGDTNSKTTSYSPIATVVTYFGGDSGNSLKTLIEFTTGVEWTEVDGKELHKVSGEAGSNPQALADQFIERGEPGTGSSILDAIGRKGLALADKYVSLGKALSFFSPGAFSATRANAQKLNAAQQDPYENGPLSNKILGPVNVITKVKKRAQGMKFEQGGLSITCTYTSRAIGGINPKAAMLDIMSNCLVMGSANAMFWGGGYRFDIAPRDYPYSYPGNTLGVKSFLNKFAQGKIFGSDGAIMEAFSGIKSIGTTGGEFSFGAVIENIGSVFGDALKGIGGFIQDAINNIFNTNINVIDQGKEENVSAKDKVSNWFKNAVGNVSEMYRSSIMKETVLPQVTGFRALLTGEPVGNWHLTIGNPLNPICVIGNLICNDVKISFSDEMGPDDFPLEMTAVFKLEHAMARDSASIQSMFNRGNGRIYKLPDYINATSDHESHVDNFTGQLTDFMNPKFMGPGLWGAAVGKSYKLSDPVALATQGDPSGLVTAAIMPYYKDAIASGIEPANRNLSIRRHISDMSNSQCILPVYKAHATARKELR